MFQVGGRYEHDFSGMAADAQEIFRINGIHDKFVKIQTDFLYRSQRKNTSGDNHPLCFFERRIAGLVWCIGYIGYNHFKGTEDPDWAAIEERWRAKHTLKEDKMREKEV